MSACILTQRILSLSRLSGNLICFNNISFCTLKQKQQVPNSTNLGPCGAISSPTDQSANPVASQNCACASPFQGLMIFRAPAFSDVTNPKSFQPLEFTLVQNLSLAPGSVAISNVEFSPGEPLTFTVKVFPESGTSFNHSEVIRISSSLVNQTYKAPAYFGPYSFIASTYFASMALLRSAISFVCFIFKHYITHSFQAPVVKGRQWAKVQ
mgnify:CR=1 FL=1